MAESERGVASEGIITVRGGSFGRTTRKTECRGPFPLKASILARKSSPEGTARAL